MSNVINIKTGRFLTSVHTPDYKGTDWIVNPSQADIDKYKVVPKPIDPDLVEKERLIELKKREMAIEALKTDGVLDSDEKLIKE